MQTRGGGHSVQLVAQSAGEPRETDPWTSQRLNTLQVLLSPTSSEPRVPPSKNWWELFAKLFVGDSAATSSPVMTQVPTILKKARMSLVSVHGYSAIVV